MDIELHMSVRRSQQVASILLTEAREIRAAAAMVTAARQQNCEDNQDKLLVSAGAAGIEQPDEGMLGVRRYGSSDGRRKAKCTTTAAAYAVLSWASCRP